jgi:hypothetical protein
MRKITGVALSMATAMATMAVATFVLPAEGLAQVAALTEKDLQTNRGTVLAIDPETRTMVVDTGEGGDLAYTVLDGVKGFSALTVGTKIELKFYRIVDVLVAKTTPEVNARVRVLMGDMNQAPDVPGTKLKARLWGAAGMATRIDLAANKVDVAQGGVIYHSPTIRTEAGRATMKTFKPGDRVTLLFTERTAVELTPAK